MRAMMAPALARPSHVKMYSGRLSITSATTEPGRIPAAIAQLATVSIRDREGDGGGSSGATSLQERARSWRLVSRRELRREARG